jgi:cyclic pyranopterin phosphate synthase
MKNLPPTPMLDALQRPIHDLRISVTDRCNFRCVYCMPKHIFGPDYPFLKRAQLLSYEEIERVARVFVTLGVRKLRLTGGEPLVRKDIEILIERLSAIEGIQDISLTTNGSLLTLQKAKKLYDAGLRRVTVSLDSLDGETFKSMNGINFAPESVLSAIDAAASIGLTPVKINMVVKRGVNDNAVLSAARHFRGTGHVLRFIEYMDVGNSNKWQMSEVISAAEIRKIIGQEFSIEPVSPDYHGEVAQKWRYADGGGEIGIIASVSQPFCGSCTRARLSADGSLFTCLFASEGHDLRALLRQGISDADLSERIRTIWTARADRYSELRAEQTVDVSKIEMSYIGG